MSLTPRLRDLVRDVRGVTAVEFALIAPAVILVYLASSQLIVALAAERRASHVASAIADLVAQNANTSKAQLDAVMDIGPTIMEPFPAKDGPLKMRISSVWVNPTGQPLVRWSRDGGLPALPLNSTPNEFPTDFRVAGEAFVLGEIQYDYKITIVPSILKPVFDLGTDGVWKFKRTFYLRPRRGAEVLCDDCNK